MSEKETTKIDIVKGDIFHRHILISTVLKVDEVTDTHVTMTCLEPVELAGQSCEYEISRLMEPRLQWQHDKVGERG